VIVKAQVVAFFLFGAASWQGLQSYADYQSINAESNLMIMLNLQQLTELDVRDL